MTAWLKSAASIPACLPIPLGNARRVLLLCWTVLFFTAVTSAIAILPSVVKTAKTPVSPAATFGLMSVTTDVGAVLVSTFGPARRAGVHAGDVLVAVGNDRVAFGTTAINRQFERVAGGSVTVVIRSKSGKLSKHTIDRDPTALARALGAVGLTPMVLALLSAGLVYCGETVPIIICAVLLMARRSRDPLAPWASLMMLFMVIGNGYTGGWFAMLFPEPWLVEYVTNALAYSLLNVVLAVFPTGRFEPRWSFWAALLGVAGAVISEPLSNQISNAILVITMFISIGAVLARYRQMPLGTSRQQIRWALLGFVASMLSLALTALLQAARANTMDVGVFAWTTISSTLFGAGFESLLIIAMTVALMRYRLYGADATISRSVTYGALTVGLLAVFAASEKLFEIMGDHLFGDRLGATAGALGAAAAAVTIVPLHHRITLWAERRFRTGLAHLRKGLPLLVGDLRETADPKTLADTMLARVEAGVHACHGAVIAGKAVLDVRDIDAATVDAWRLRTRLPDERGLVLDRSDPVFPVRMPLIADGVGRVGWLLLGPRPDGTFYGREERTALEEIADPVARALAIAIKREQQEALRLQDIIELREEVSTLKAILGVRGLGSTHEARA